MDDGMESDKLTEEKRNLSLRDCPHILRNCSFLCGIRKKKAT